jgi:DDE superfamily endonuclease
MRAVNPERLVFLDESGVSTQMTRRFGRARGGRRVHESTPEGNWKILTVLGAMSLGGMIATMTVEAATDADIFLAYLDHFLCRELKPGDVVVMDNLSSHKVAGVRERIEAVGANSKNSYARPELACIIHEGTANGCCERKIAAKILLAGR